MPDYDNKGSGLLFKNVSENPKAPVLSGFFEGLDGTKYKIACWPCKNQQGQPHTDRAGNKYLTIQVKLDEEAPAPPPPPVDSDDPW